jgi:hypothetical protein
MKEDSSNLGLRKLRQLPAKQLTQHQISLRAAFLTGDEPTLGLDLSMASFDAKLAVRSPRGSACPLHVDNPEGSLVDDTMKLTCVLCVEPGRQGTKMEETFKQSWVTRRTSKQLTFHFWVGP